MSASKKGWNKPLNPMFVEYLKGQGLCESEEEYGRLIDVLTDPLPVTFRVCAREASALEYMTHVLGTVMTEVTAATRSEAAVAAAEAAMAADEANPVFVTSPKDGSTHRKLLRPMGPVPDLEQLTAFDPSGRVWKLDISRRDLSGHTGLTRLHSFLKMAEPAGLITRQELVSMIPVSVAGIEPHHAVLDMCAAPGSKTAQIMETIGSAGGSGFVMANELDMKRSHLLTHQIQRLRTASAMVVSHAAQYLPTLVVDGQPFRFDRVLADVPCTGSGTFRKSPTSRAAWKSSGAMTLHPLQVAIALRGAKLTALGGFLVYSTCSLNPVENEAVVAAILQGTSGGMKLVDAHARLPGFSALPGLTTWRVMNNNGEWYDTLESVNPRYKSTYGVASAFPPSPDAVDPAEFAKCMRVLPQTEDTGGFFVAVFEKVGEFSLSIVDDAILAEPDDIRKVSKRAAKRAHYAKMDAERAAKGLPPPENAMKTRKPQVKLSTHYDLPFFVPEPGFFDEGLAVWGIDRASLGGELIVRSTTENAMVNWIPSQLAPILSAVTSNAVLPFPEDAPFPKHESLGLNIVNMGLKVFRLSPSTRGCPLRIVSSGLPVYHSHITRRVVETEAHVLQPFFEFETDARGTRHVVLSGDMAHIQLDTLALEAPGLVPLVRDIEALGATHFVVRAQRSGASPVAISGFITQTFVTLFVSKKARDPLAFQLFGETLGADAAGDAATTLSYT